VKFFKIKKSKIDNNGLYASCNIKKGTRIIEYKGKVITRKQSEESSKFDNSRAIYLFNLNKRFDLDGDFKFNTARLINHSCEPNCEVTGSGLKVWVYAIKDIKKNEIHGPNFLEKMIEINEKEKNFQISVRHSFPIERRELKYIGTCQNCGEKFFYRKRIKNIACKKCCVNFFNGSWNKKCLILFD